MLKPKVSRKLPLSKIFDIRRKWSRYQSNPHYHHSLIRKPEDILGEQEWIKSGNPLLILKSKDNPLPQPTKRSNAHVTFQN